MKFGKKKEPEKEILKPAEAEAAKTEVTADAQASEAAKPEAPAATREEAIALFEKIEEIKKSDDPHAKAAMLDMLGSIIEPEDDTETDEERLEEAKHPAWGSGRRLRGRIHARRTLLIDAVLVLLIGMIIFFADSPGKVTGLKVADTTYDSVSLTWEATEKAAGYHIYRSDDGEDYNYLATTKSTNYTDLGIITGKTYKYSVTAYSGIRRQGPDEKKAVSAVPSLDTPELKGDMETGQIQLSFAPVKGAIGYEIYRNGKKIADQKETSFTDETAKNDTEYKYEVKAYRYKKHPVYSLSSNLVKLKLVPVSKLEAAIEGDNILFTWASSENYATYELYNGTELLDTTSNTKYMIESFDPEKKYEMKLIGISEDGEMRSPANRQTFEITSTPMTNQDAVNAACEWAEMIAADDSFTYGAGKRAHRYGCYFCGTNVGPNKNIKGKSLVNGHSYEKTYCCNPFVHAAYAHGAGDPAMLKACQNGGGVAMSAKSYTRYGHWTNKGKISYGSLKRGDVLVCPSHVALYVGNGQIAQAADNDGAWTATSIRVNGMSKSRYESKWKFVMRYTGVGKGVKYEIHEVENADADKTADKADKAADKDGGKATDKTDKSDNAAEKTDKTKEDAKPETPEQDTAA